MACRQTGFAMLCSNSVQEVMDLAAVAHLSTIKGRVPFLHFFDGFRTSHEIQKVECTDYDELAKLVDYDALAEFRKSALNPEHPVMRGTAQNPDVYFQGREASNKFYDALPEIVEEYMAKVSEMTGREYKLFNYYGAADAEHVIIAMGSVTEAAREAIDYLVANGEKVGMVAVHLYRPFSAKHFLAAVPKTAKTIAVLDRTKEPGANGEPLYLDVKDCFYGTENAPVIVGGRYGLGSKDTTPAQIIAVFKNLAMPMPKNHFTIGIVDDVTFTSLPQEAEIALGGEGMFEAKFYGLGADGTVGANKNSIKIIGGSTDKYCQAYFSYDSKKSGGYTASHLRFGDKPITSPYLVTTPDFVACHVPSYVDKYDVLKGLKPGGSFLLNSVHDAETTCRTLPDHMKVFLAKNKINFYIINANKVAREIGLGNKTNTVLQSAFFSIANIIPPEDAITYMKKMAYKSFAKKGDDIVNMNYAAIDKGAGEVVKVDVPASWADCEGKLPEHKAEGDNKFLVDFVNKVQIPVNAQRGDKIPVSTFVDMDIVDGTFPQGSAAYEKRGIAVDVPQWIPENCIECNQCAFVCPHAVIRPVIMTADEAAAAPASVKVKDAMQLPGMKYTMAVSTLDCTGCGVCANICPAGAKDKSKSALVMKPIETQMDQQPVFDYAVSKVSDKPEVHEKFKETTVKGSQFKQPLLEFSGACAGCGETPYAKLVTQLFGDRMYIANATGCSSIWANSSPSTPYTTNKKGHGPAWSNSLFEDAAEFGYGMLLAQRAIRDRLKNELDEIAANTDKADVKDAIKEWNDTFASGIENGPATEKLVAALEACGCDASKNILKEKDFLAKKSQWIFGGDGWAYDIGFGGVDHVLASGKDINVMVFDTEVYSNTGGQSSKSTPTGAIAQFAAGGKETKKKDLAGIAMSYGYVYVAHISMGADMNQCVKALAEAEAYPGPSLIIAYAPCINHGIKKGMSKAQTEEKLAVESGYWFNFRYNPTLAAEGKDAFSLDSKEPTGDYQAFLKGENRYASLAKFNPERAAELFAKAEKNSKDEYDHLKKLVTLYAGK